ncbi:hypothetical protein DFJ74DRAFT_716509 [Hyaloraphidium curvatum]|nr:hypothetical protein DFJ74DRAFT_716509 [Hyaloraphidium curvatum]
MSKRARVLSLLAGGPADAVPAAFFVHFPENAHFGDAAADAHRAFFRATDADVVKVQFEQPAPVVDPPVRDAADWRRLPGLVEAHFAPTADIIGKLSDLKTEALLIATIYSPFMHAMHMAGDVDPVLHAQQDPDAVRAGLRTATQSTCALIAACRKAGLDGFYLSTQGGEAFRANTPEGRAFFEDFVVPADLEAWRAAEGCAFNVLHICEYLGPYDDLGAFREYPAHAVSCPLNIGGRQWTAAEAAAFFGKPFVGGLYRKGIIATGTPEEARRAAEEVLRGAPPRGFMLGADCTVPGDTPWANLRAAVDAAHAVKPS